MGQSPKLWPMTILTRLQSTWHLPAGVSGLLLSALTTVGLACAADVRPPPDGPARAPGRLVDAHGLQLHLYCQGSGEPAVVVERGVGDHLASWIEVQSSAARATQVCLYDRSGSGWSARDLQPPTVERMVENLRAVLQAGGIPGPYVLVGHSTGGLVVRQFAAQFPDDTAGLLLIDSAHENQIRRLPASLRREVVGETSYRFCRLEAPMELLRSAGLINSQLPIFEPENLRPMHAAAVTETRFCQMVRAEASAFRPAASRTERPHPLGDLPLIVLTAGNGMAVDAGIHRMGLPVDALQHWDGIWLALQGELAALSTRSRHRLVRGAGPYIQLDAPNAVAVAIEEVLSMVGG
jgi:pimeloyl-ACP methyl ester carboxylesterase